MAKIEYITPEQARKIIDTYLPIGLFIVTDEKVAIDNTTGEAWTEEFKTIEECENWLKN